MVTWPGKGTGQGNSMYEKQPQQTSADPHTHDCAWHQQVSSIH